MATEAVVHVVTGKGGVGKTTVALAMARTLGGTGSPTLLLDLGAGLGLSAALERGVGHEPSELAPGLDVAAMDPERAIDELVLELSPSRRIAARLLRLGSLRAFLGATPGALELAVLSRLDGFARAGRYRTIVVDADASGHLQMLLDAPAVLARIGAAGPVRGALDRAIARLTDPARARFHVVTLPTQVALEETLELARGLEIRRAPLGELLVSRAPEPIPTSPAVARALAERAAGTAAEEDLRHLVALHEARARLDRFARGDARRFTRVRELTTEPASILPEGP